MGGAVFKEFGRVFVASEGFGVVFTNSSLLAQYCLVLLHVTSFKELGPVNFASGGFGAVFCQLAVRRVPSRFDALACNQR